MNHPDHVICQITKKKVRFHDAMPASVIRPGIYDLIKKSHPDFSHDGFVSKEALKRFRGEYMETVLSEEGRELTALDKEVIQSLIDHENIAEDINKQFDEQQTFGNRVSDKMAKFGGSWTFISIFAAILIIWISINTYVLLSRPFDPFPFILLNLVLSCIAAIQAPVIMMSQNRKDAKDRLRAEHDYKVNLKAELEIRHLHEKMDHLLQHQWQRMMEIQELQLDIMEGLQVTKDVAKERGEGRAWPGNHAVQAPKKQNPTLGLAMPEGSAQPVTRPEQDPSDPRKSS